MGPSIIGPSQLPVGGMFEGSMLFQTKQNRDPRVTELRPWRKVLTRFGTAVAPWHHLFEPHFFCSTSCCSVGGILHGAPETTSTRKFWGIFWRHPRKIHRCRLCFQASGDTRIFSGGGDDASLDLENSGVRDCIAMLDLSAVLPEILEIYGEFL